MHDILETAEPVSKPEGASNAFAAWNRRLLIAATVFILWAASLLAVQGAGLHVQAMLAGEGMLTLESQ